MPDVSALGAALLSGLQSGVYESIEALTKMNAGKKYFHPADTSAAEKKYSGWQQEIQQFSSRQ
jgi:glycerol kinase